MLTIAKNHFKKRTKSPINNVFGLKIYIYILQLPSKLGTFTELYIGVWSVGMDRFPPPPGEMSILVKMCAPIKIYWGTLMEGGN